MPTPIHILADATLPELTELFKHPYQLTRYQTQTPVIQPEHEVLLCRSTLRIDANLLANSNIKCVATASSGIDHVDCDYLRQHNITLFDAKGANARAVADYVVATLALLSQSGQLTGLRAGVIGIGEVGSRVVTRLKAAGFNVVCFDPLKAQGSLVDLVECDVLCIHANLHDTPPYPSTNLLNAEFLAQLKPNVTIINAARGGIVDEEALLTQTKHITYCTDVYHNEPAIDPRIIDFATLCTPHIAGHSIEAKQRAVIQLSEQLHHYYGLTMPQQRNQHHHHANIVAQNNWQACALFLYDPRVDTQVLKTALDKKNAFLTQRKAHQHRHDFNVYEAVNLDRQSRLVLGSCGANITANGHGDCI